MSRKSEDMDAADAVSAPGQAGPPPTSGGPPAAGTSDGQQDEGKRLRPTNTYDTRNTYSVE